VGDIYTIRTTRKNPPVGQTYPFVVSLEVPPRSLPHGVVCDNK